MYVTIYVERSFNARHVSADDVTNYSISLMNYEAFKAKGRKTFFIKKSCPDTTEKLTDVRTSYNSWKRTYQNISFINDI